MDRYAHTIFCDDIRHEIGNKISFIGTYSSSLLLSRVPATLPKFCAAVRAVTPADHPFKEFTIRVLLNDVELQSVTIEGDELAHLAVGTPRPNDSDADSDSELVMRLDMHFIISPFEVKELGRLKVRIDTELGVLKAGSLRIEEMETALNQGAHDAG